MHKRAGTTAALLTLALAACGGTPAATQGPDGGATTEPGGGAAATTDPGSGGGGGGGGGKPAGWDRYGKVHIEVSGPVQKTAEYGFVPAGSIFGGAQGSSLSFFNEGTDEIVSILAGPDGKVVVSYGGLDFTAPGTDCTTSNWNVGATSASGSFDCKGFAILASGAQATDLTIKGSFEARAS